MDRFRILSLVLSLSALVALSTASVEIAAAESAGIVSSQTGAGASCPVNPHDSEGRKTTAGIHGLEGLAERLAAVPADNDVIPLNNGGYHYGAQQTPSNKVLFFEGELQNPSSPSH